MDGYWFVIGALAGGLVTAAALAFLFRGTERSHHALMLGAFLGVALASVVGLYAAQHRNDDRQDRENRLLVYHTAQKIRQASIASCERGNTLRRNQRLVLLVLHQRSVIFAPNSGAEALLRRNTRRVDDALRTVHQVDCSAQFPLPVLEPGRQP